MKFSHGIRTVPAGSMRFVDFSKPDPGEERSERFMIAAQRAMAEGDYELAAQRLIYARDAEPQNVAVLRQMTLAFWHAGNLEAAARSVRDWARVDGGHPAAHRFAARIYEDIGAVDLAEEAASACGRAGPGRRRRVGAAGTAAPEAARPRGRPEGARARTLAGRGQRSARSARAGARARAAHGGGELSRHLEPIGPGRTSMKDECDSTLIYGDVDVLEVREVEDPVAGAGRGARGGEGRGDQSG